MEEIVGDDGKKGINPNYVFWLNNDGLLVSWLSGIMTVDIFSMINGGETAKDVWSSLEEQLLPNTVEKEALLKNVTKSNIANRFPYQ